MLVKEIMKKNVITVNAKDSVFDACNKYKEYKIGCLVVVEDGSCVGIVTERDLIERTICENRDPKSTKINEIMSTDIKTVHALDTVEKALGVMKKFNIKKLPVVVDKGIVGMLTVTDISRARPDLSKRFIESWVKPVWKD
ncbi:MAG: CBS domain-containing protein [Candidatus Heimdallarchaeaceae archaeon]